jgi:hypothetical protein
MSFFREAMPLASTNEKSPIGGEFAITLQHNMFTGPPFDLSVEKHSGQLAVQSPIQQCCWPFKWCLVTEVKNND